MDEQSLGNSIGSKMPELIDIGLKKHTLCIPTKQCVVSDVCRSVWMNGVMDIQMDG